MSNMTADATMVTSTILEILDQKVNDQEVFTAYDVTKDVRAKMGRSVSVPHNSVRAVVVQEFASGRIPDYNSELHTLNVVDSPVAMVYFPDGKSATDHDQVDVFDDDDSTEGDSKEDLDDDEYHLTSEGRVEIPQKLLTQVTANAGSYDILISGSLKCVTPNKDGRVRLSLKHMGITDKVKLIVDTANNTINMETS